MYKLAPSILSADFSRLGSELKLIEKAGAHYVHIDVMDGSFVPSITLGAPVVKSIRKITDMTFDVHLMINEPERHIEDFAVAGADIITPHIEACGDPRRVIQRIKSRGIRAALSVKPQTPVEAVYDFLDDLDMVLIMSVEPGRGGQQLIPEMLKKAEKLAGFISNNKLLTEIEMDGGIYLSNISDVLDSGVNIVVAGSAVFGAKDPTGAVRDFYNAFKAANILNAGNIC